MSLRLTQQQIDQLGHRLACTHAASVIETYALHIRVKPTEVWYELTEQDLAFGVVRECTLYLDSRGLIERHPRHTEWMRIRGEALEEAVA